jgi:hypothetical protein
MAELQWIIEVKCINAFLGEVKVGEKGEYVIVNIPNSNFLPSELDKLITVFEIAEKINEENRLSYKPKLVEKLEEPNDFVEVIDKRDFAQISILATGEIVNINVPENVLTPTEAHRLMNELKRVSQTMIKLRE